MAGTSLLVAQRRLFEPMPGAWGAFEHFAVDHGRLVRRVAVVHWHRCSCQTRRWSRSQPIDPMHDLGPVIYQGPLLALAE
jgi:hypothetical protein